MANPPFNISDWGGEKYENDPRWKYGRPPVGNANYAWLQHMLWKLKPGGRAGVVLANGSISSNTGGEGQIREAMIRGDVVEVMITFSGNLFLNTDVPCCLWFFTNDKTKNGRNRAGETLFINGTECSTPVEGSRKHKELKQEQIDLINLTVEKWRTGNNYKDTLGFCKSASLEEIEKNGFALNPARYVGTIEFNDDAQTFREKFNVLDEEYRRLNLLSDDLSKKIEKYLKLLRNEF
jgi:type I restriction enzyme M protein